MANDSDEVTELSEIQIREEMERTGDSAETVIERLTGERPRILRQQREAAAGRIKEFFDN